MKKIAFFVFVFLVLALGGFVSQANSGYVRKKVKPNFFMPEEKAVKGEKLPSFPALDKGILKVSDDGVVLVKKTVTTYVPTKKEKELPLPKKAKSTNYKKANSYNKNRTFTTYTPEEGLGDDFDKSERYLAMKESYENDLQVIAKTGKIPQNEQLLRDLQKMNSEMPFMVK